MLHCCTCIGSSRTSVFSFHRIPHAWCAIPVPRSSLASESIPMMLHQHIQNVGSGQTMPTVREIEHQLPIPLTRLSPFAMHLLVVMPTVFCFTEVLLCVKLKLLLNFENDINHVITVFVELTTFWGKNLGPTHCQGTRPHVLILGSSLKTSELIRLPSFQVLEWLSFVLWDIMSSNVSLSTASLKKNKVFPDMSTAMPPCRQGRCASDDQRMRPHKCTLRPTYHRSASSIGWQQHWLRRCQSCRWGSG